MLSSLLLAVTIVAHGPGYHASMANHVKRWLGAENVHAHVVTRAQMPAALASERIAFLVGFEKPSAAEVSTLTDFESRGGKVVVFSSSSPALANLVGVKPVGYRAAAYPGEFSRMQFV